MLTLTPPLPVSTGFADARTFLEMIKDTKKFDKAIAEFEDHYVKAVAAKAGADAVVAEANTKFEALGKAMTEAEATLARAKAARLEIQAGFEKLAQDNAALEKARAGVEEARIKTEEAWASVKQNRKHIEAEQAAATEAILEREKQLAEREAAFNVKIEAAKAFLGATP